MNKETLNGDIFQLFDISKGNGAADMFGFLKDKRFLLVLGVIGAVMIAAAWFLFTKGPLGPTKVGVGKVTKQNLNPSVFGIGTVEARLAYSVGPTQAGRLLKVHFDQGDLVKKNQLLGEMDAVDLVAKKAAADAALAKAEQNIAAFEAQITEAASRKELTGKTAARYRELYAAQAISAEALENKQNEAIAAAASYEAATASASAAREEVVKARAERTGIEQQLNNLRLVSPVDALVIARDAEPGATVVAGQAVFRLVDTSTLWVRTRIDQSRFYGIALGQEAEIVLRSRQDRLMQGRVARLEVQGDSVTEERFVNVSFDDLGGFIPLGELAEVTIKLPSEQNVLVVPTAAVKKIDKTNGVWVVKANKIKFVSVQIGAQTLEGQTHIIKGVEEGDTVVIYSPQLLKEDMEVRVETKS